MDGDFFDKSASQIQITAWDDPVDDSFQGTTDKENNSTTVEKKIKKLFQRAHTLYNNGNYKDSLQVCEQIYDIDTFRTENLLLLGAIHFQLRNFSESIFYNQQCIRVDPAFAESYSNLGNALKELGDVSAAVQFYLKVILYT